LEQQIIKVEKKFDEEFKCCIIDFNNLKFQGHLPCVVWGNMNFALGFLIVANQGFGHRFNTPPNTCLSYFVGGRNIMVFGDFVVEIYEEYLIWITQTSLDFIKK